MPKKQNIHVTMLKKQWSNMDDDWDDLDYLEPVERIRRQPREMTRKEVKVAAQRQRDREIGRVYKRIKRERKQSEE